MDVDTIGCLTTLVEMISRDLRVSGVRSFSFGQYWHCAKYFEEREIPAIFSTEK